MQDLAGAWIGLRHTDGPAAAITVGPLNRGVPYVQGIGAFRQIFDHKRVAKARLLESLVPPQRPFARSRADRLGNRLIKIEDNGLNWITDGSSGIFLLQAPAGDVSLVQRIFVTSREVL